MNFISTFTFGLASSPSFYLKYIIVTSGSVDPEPVDLEDMLDAAG